MPVSRSQGEASHSTRKARVQRDVVSPNLTFTPPSAAAPARPQERVDKPLLDGRNQRGRPQQLGQNHSQQDGCVSLHITRKARNSLRKLTQEVGRHATSGETRNPVLDSKTKVLNRVILSPSLAFAKVLLKTKTGIAPLGSGQSRGKRRVIVCINDIPVVHIQERDDARNRFHHASRPRSEVS